MVDTGDLKSPASDGVQVRLLFRAITLQKQKALPSGSAFCFCSVIARKASQEFGLRRESKPCTVSSAGPAFWTTTAKLHRQKGLLFRISFLQKFKLSQAYAFFVKVDFVKLKSPFFSWTT
jgi:hypothetical protein